VHCSICNRQLRIGDAYCSQCGATVKMACARCHTPLDTDDLFCRVCGSRVDGSGSEPIGTEAAPKGGDPEHLILPAASQELTLAEQPPIAVPPVMPARPAPASPVRRQPVTRAGELPEPVHARPTAATSPAQRPTVARTIQPPISERYIYKGLLPRFAATVLDGYVLALPLGVIAWLIMMVGGSFFRTETRLIAAAGAFFGIALAILSVILEAGGGTPGKRMLGMRIIDATGAPPGLGRALVRGILRLVDFIPAVYLLGAVLVTMSAKHQRLGDLAARTFVVGKE